MTLARDLLEQARHLALKEPRRPKQASLRRAISSAYYAIFHLLTSESAARLTPKQPADLKCRVQRAFGHRDMKKVCEAFSKPTLPDHWNFASFNPVPSDLKKIAKVFVELQEARHLADYDLSATTSRLEVMKFLTDVDDAFAAWQAVRLNPYANVFLSALLLGDKTRRS